LVAEVQIAREFESFYRDEYHSVLALAVALTRDLSAAEELTQDAFVAALRRWDDVRGMDNPTGWVRRVVTNRSVSRVRRRIIELKALTRLGSSTPVPGPEIGDGIDLWKEVQRLPRRQAQVIALVYVSGLPRREVAEVLGCSEETVKTHLDRARRKLSTRLPGGSES